ncbi:retrotransposon protein, putative, ty1-copia subclass [Tanacetum coccineum]
MASSMSPELQKTFENTWAYEMNQQLKEMFQAKASMDPDVALEAYVLVPKLFEGLHDGKLKRVVNQGVLKDNPRYSRIGHVNKIRIAQLQKDGVLESFDFKSDDVCESCLLGKMTKSPFIGSCERELTPTRTPQLNRVAERRNITLLDMVQSMMSRATLPISFWGYALETTAHILNPVPTTKDNVVIGARRGVFLEREIISKEDSGSKIDLEEIQEYVDEEPIVNTDTQQEVVTPIKLYDISLHFAEQVGRCQQAYQFLLWFHMNRTRLVIDLSRSLLCMTCTRPDVSFALSMLVTASKECFIVKNFIGDLGVVPTVQDPIEIFCDNESAVALTKEPKDHRKSKHIERKYHFV